MAHSCPMRARAMVASGLRIAAAPYRDRLYGEMPDRYA
jgi:hypothetical protein